MEGLGVEEMANGTREIDLIKLSFYILKRIWLVLISAIIGFCAM